MQKSHFVDEKTNKEASGWICQLNLSIYLDHACPTFLRNWPLFWGQNLFGRNILGPIVTFLLCDREFTETVMI